jgi:tetratricopeptide (TPR) repeat protein
MEKMVLAAVLLALTGCATTNEGLKFANYPVNRSTASVMGLELPTYKSAELDAMSPWQRVTYEGVKALRSHDFPQASRLFNVALKMNVTRSDLHLLNALTYHLMAKEGDGSKYELAEEGYRSAIKFDDNNWLAHYYFGLCNLDQRKFAVAQRSLASAAAIQTHDANLLYDLAVASYYARDPLVANGALQRLAIVDPAYAAQDKVLHTTALVRATLNDQAGAGAAVDRMRAGKPTADLTTLQHRLEDWGTFYKASAPANDGLSFTQVADNGFNNPGSPSGGFSVSPYPTAPGAYPSAPSAYPSAPSAYPMAPTMGGSGSATPFVDDKMVVVDVVIIGTQEDSRTTYGVNLLNGLKLQFGDSASLTPAFSKGTTITTTGGDDGSSRTSTNTLNRLVRIPSVTYSLNIANAINGQDEVLAKPSLVALSGQTSEFFSGVEISAAAVSGGAGDSISIQKEIGVKLSVRPDFLPDNRVRLQVSAQRTFLTDPSNSVVFTYRLDTTKTNVNANVVLKFGETLILSGLTERDVTKSADGVPFLRDIPGLNLLFSEHGKRDYQKSILILLTPRKPVYTAQSAEDRQAALAGMSDYERSVERLQMRNKDWFQPQPSFEEVRKSIDTQEFFREFRMGDVPVDAWEKRESNKGALAKALKDLI